MHERCSRRSVEAFARTAYLIGGWLGMLGGVLSGAMVGMFFPQEGWIILRGEVLEPLRDCL